MKVLIVGLGSIAKKHIKALREINPSVELFALRSQKFSEEIDGITNLYDWSDVASDTSFIIISNPTHNHFETIKEAAKLGIPLFIEKPPFQSMKGAEKLADTLKKDGIKTYTAFNMRFLPILKWLKNELIDKRVLEVQIYCGSYLPDWRPGYDYREIYSSKKEMGGGAHLDLIHEIDYALWIFGIPEKVKNTLLTISDLDINSIDCAHYFLQYKNKIVTILLNYYRRNPKRTIEIVMANDEWSVDLLKGTVKNHLGEILYKSDVTIMDTYKLQLNYFINSLESGKVLMNSLNESINTLKICTE